VIAGTVLPHLAARDARLLAHESDFASNDAELVRLRNTVLEWKAEAARHGKPVKLPYMPFLLRNIWTGAMLLFSALMLATFFVTRVYQVSPARVHHLVVGLKIMAGHRLGQPRRHLVGGRQLGAVRDHHGGGPLVCVVLPLLTVVQFLKEMEKPSDDSRGRTVDSGAARPASSTTPAAPRPTHTRVMSTPAYLTPGVLTDGERQPLLRHRSMDDGDINDAEQAGPVAGGTILGIHNLAIVMPQFVVSTAVAHLCT
jgi:solute carrier family 45 protein 1/2/4